MSIRVTIIDGAADTDLKASNLINRITDTLSKNFRLSISHLIWAGIIIVSVNVLVVKYFQMNNFNGNSNSVAAVSVDDEECLPALNDRSLLKSIDENGIICQTEVLAQAKLESGNYRSVVFRKGSNLFGMRYPKKRETKAIGVFLQGKGDIIYGTKEELKPYLSMPNYAVYANWEDCVADYKIWQDYSFKTREKYLTFLHGMYAEDSNYISRIKHISAKADRMLVED